MTDMPRYRLRAPGRLVLLLCMVALAAAGCGSDHGGLPTVSTDSADLEPPVRHKLDSLNTDLAAAPMTPDRVGRMGVNLYVHDFKREAIAYFMWAAEREPGEVRWPYYAAIASEDIGDPAARGWYERALPLRENYLPLRIRLARRQRADGDIAAARATLFHALELDDRHPFAHLELARLALDEGRPELAEKHLTVALKSRPRFREALGALAEVVRQRGMPDSAASLLERTADLPPRTDMPDPLYGDIVAEGVSSVWCEIRGARAMAAGRYADAEREFRRGLTARKSAEGFNNLGQSLHYQGRHAAADSAFRAAIALDAAFHDAWNNLAVSLYRQGRHEPALDAAREALALSPDDVDAHLNLGTILKARQRYGDARDAFRSGQRIARTDPRFAYQLAWLLSTCPEAGIRDRDGARHQARLLVDTLGHRSPAALSAYAAAYAVNGIFEPAMTTARYALDAARRGGDRALTAVVEAQLDHYRNGRIYVDAAKTPGDPAP